MFATDNRAGLVSVRYQPSSTNTAIDNGCVVLLNGLETGSREVHKGVTPAANSNLNDIVLIASPEVMYDERLRNLDDYYNEAGKIARGYRLKGGDMFGVTKDVLAGKDTPAVGDYVELKADVKLNVVASPTASTTLVGNIYAIENVGRYTYYVIKVLADAVSVDVDVTTGVDTLAELTDVDLTVAATDGQVLKYDNTSGKWIAGDDATA
jgi:hypothetical protein